MGQYIPFAAVHLQSAAFQTRRALAIEQELDLPEGLSYRALYERLTDNDERYVEHTACVIGAIFAAAAATEAIVTQPFVRIWEAVQHDEKSRQDIEQRGGFFASTISEGVLKGDSRRAVSWGAAYASLLTISPRRRDHELCDRSE